MAAQPLDMLVFSLTFAVVTDFAAYQAGTYAYYWVFFLVHSDVPHQITDIYVTERTVDHLWPINS